MKPKTKSLFLALFLSVQFNFWAQPQTSDSLLKVQYQTAITNAMSPNPLKIYKQLTPIVLSNKNLIWKKINGEDYLLMLTWKADSSYYKDSVYNTSSYPIWVTVAPELLQKLHACKPEDTILRLEQLLGLPPQSNYQYFIEFWVSPKDLFRPCADAEITDKACELCFPYRTCSDHIAWINNLRIESYYNNCELFKKYPWTQLGYTYDWSKNGTDFIGLSEFVIHKNSIIYKNKIYTNNQYLRQNYTKNNKKYKRETSR